jgi:carbon storage regulator
MLVLSRKVGEEIIIDGVIRVRIVDVGGGKVRLGITAPPDVTIDRQEIHEKKREWVLNPTVARAIACPAVLVAI